MKKTIINMVKLHKSRISGATQCDELKILSHCFAPSATKSKILPLCPSIAVIYATCLIALLVSSFIGIFVSSSVSALTYSEDVGVNFTFNPSITVSLSSASGGSNADLVINDLTPGTSSDSNVIDVNVLSNNANGYVLNSSVGNNSTYSTALDNLVHSDITISSTSPKFTNLATNADLASMDDSTDDNVWGYSYLDTTLTGSTWSNYNGLPLYSDTEHTTTLKTSTNPSLSTGDIIKFKIAAKASTTQASGEYNNVINFTVVGTANPVSFYDAFSAAGKQMHNGYYAMQDMTTSICNNVYTSQLADNTDTMEAQLIDIRDNNVYWVAKLKDGHCWMTQNLDLNLDSSVALTSNDTDLREAGVNGYVDGYETRDGVIYWTPKRSTVDAVTTESTSINRFTWGNTDDEPYSMDSGKWYWKGTYYSSSVYCPISSDTIPTYIGCDYISKMTQDSRGTAIINNWATYFGTNDNVANGGAHDHVGNYYNWPATIASNDAGSYAIRTDTEDTVSNNPANSICPINWRLPTITVDYENGGGHEHNDFYTLNYLYNGGSFSSDEGVIDFPAFFVRGGGAWGGNLHTAGYRGAYWSSTVSSAFQARTFYFHSDGLRIKDLRNRQEGSSVRCLVR